MNHRFESIIAKEIFKSRKPDMLDITILDMLSDEPLNEWDVMDRLEETGIPGYEHKTIHERLEMYAETYEAMKVRTGYVAMSEDYQLQLQLNMTYHQCRRPPAKVLENAYNPRFHTFIEDGIDTKESHRIPVPKDSRVFTRIYYTNSSKYATEFFSHIHAFKYKDGPITSIDLWFYGVHSH